MRRGNASDAAQRRVARPKVGDSKSQIICFGDNEIALLSIQLA